MVWDVLVFELIVLGNGWYLDLRQIAALALRIVTVVDGNDLLTNQWNLKHSNHVPSIQFVTCAKLLSINEMRC